MSAQKRTASGALGGLLGFVGVSAVAGVLVVAAVTPAIAVTGMAANSTIGIFEGLPSYLQPDKLMERSNIYATTNEGTPYLLASFYDQNRVEVPWENVSQFAKDGAVATEDPRFYEHGGIDIQGTVRGALTTAFGGDVQGGSSITQQYVKNVLVQKGVLEATTPEEEQAAYDEATETTPERKLKEMRLAIGVEKEFSKDQILLGYLNIALFGGRVYGIEAAAQYYFGVSAKDLNLQQAATLVAIVNNPDNLRIDRPDNEVNGAADGYAETKIRRDYVLDQMLKYQKITQEQYDAAIATPIEPTITEPSTGCQTAGGSGYFCDYVTKIIQNDPNLGYDALQRGGLQIYTSLDLDVQAAAETAINNNVPQAMDGFDVGAVAVTIQPGTGRVLAMAQNKIYSQDPEVQAQGPQYSGINYNTDFAYGGSTGFQPGSTYKVFTLAEWLKEGHALNETVDARRKNWTNFTDSCLGTQYYSDFNPRNDEGGNGGFWTALYNTYRSENTGFIAMAQKLDLCEIRKTAESFGVHRADGEPLAQGASAVLGTNEIAPLTMAEAFGGIANNGMTCTPVAIDKILDSDGAEVPAPQSTCTQSVDPKIAAGMEYAMQRVMTSGGTGGPSAGAINGSWPLIGKTGTSDNNEATWMSGGSNKVITVTGLFNVTGHVDQRDTYINGNQAAVIRHTIWPAVMNVALPKYGGDAFADADPSVLQATSVTIPDVRGMSAEDAASVIENAGFSAVVGDQVDSDLPQGQVAGTTPTGGASRGTLITINVSNGQGLTVPDVTDANDFNGARGILQNAGFTNIAQSCVVASSPGDVNKPQSSNPQVGAVANRSSTVTVAIAKPNC
ncbi:transglycosylase domain-containing protein [Compostimonas suwonensis]|uniref:Membrane peptidoglycan carboxypeptidase n=1 Tax=Compostimonas suwonensis TaxID=1048394 RepID=A0A2M9BC78_9MICO|nr:transglycosylase domain-containing protein [Compostimonas suwonensis]PJJ55524.1 membrane peptidoglycan carboxypeptidase [Compostimonas suwonensis]